MFVAGTKLLVKRGSPIRSYRNLAGKTVVVTAGTTNEKALEEIRAGRPKTWEKFEVPDEGIGCGFTEAVRGVLSHHMVVRGGKIAVNYSAREPGRIEKLTPHPSRLRRAPRP